MNRRPAVICAVSSVLAGCDGVTPDCFEGSPLAVTVEVDPSLSPPPDPVFECSPPANQEFCYAGSQAGIRATLEDLFVIEVVYMGFVGWWPWIGIDTESQRARLCANYYSDTPGDHSQCDPPLCASSGTITVSRLPENEDDAVGIAVELDVRFDDGGTIRGSFWID